MEEKRRRKGGQEHKGHRDKGTANSGNRSKSSAFAFYVASAQDKTIILKHITTSDGLSDNQVTCMLRDNLGFMWIGTKDGLNRNDGREFYVFKHNPEDVNSVCGNNIK